jgi:hypothetical protein
MIIKPGIYEEDGLSKNKKYVDEYGNVCKDILKRISLNSEGTVGRLETISIVNDWTDNAYNYVNKECAIGPVTIQDNRPFLNLENYSYSTSESTEGRCFQGGGYTQYPGFADSYVDYGFNFYTPRSTTPLDRYNKRVIPSIRYEEPSIDKMRGEVIAYENIYQLPYIETLGLLNTFLATWSFSYPIECDIVIRSKEKKFNIPRILFMPGLREDSMKELYCILLHDVDKMCNYLFNVLEKENRNLSIHAFLHPFGAVMKVKDNGRKAVEDFNIYNPNHVNEIMRNVVAGGINYLKSESSGIMREGNFKDLYEDALECCDSLI